MIKNKQCVNCGKNLKGRQEKYCSVKCERCCYRKHNKDKIREEKRKYYQDNKESILQGYQENHNERKRKAREYYSINNSSMLSAISYKTPNSTSIGVDS